MKVCPVTQNVISYHLKTSEKGEDKESKGRRVCRAGTGIEVNQGKGEIEVSHCAV